MLIPPPSTDICGFVSARIIRRTADSGLDTDSYPDAWGVRGQVKFTAIEKIVTTGNPKILELRDPVYAPLNDTGTMVSPADWSLFGIWLLVGAYHVTFELEDASLNGFDIEVLETHTQFAPLDLVTELPRVSEVREDHILLVPPVLHPGEVLARNESGELYGVPLSSLGLNSNAYSWVRYADTITGDGISALSIGKTHLGIAVNKPTGIASNNPEDYIWAKITGDPGVDGIAAPGIYLTSTAQMFVVNADGDIFPDEITVVGTGMNTTPSVWFYAVDGAPFTDLPPVGVTRQGVVVVVDGAAFEGRQLVIRATDSHGVTGTTAIAKIHDGATGEQGIEGVSVVTIEEQYYVSQSNTELIDGTWSTVVPNFPVSGYLWLRSEIFYSSGEREATPPISISAERGADGSSVLSADVWYYSSTSNVVVVGGHWATTSPLWAEGTYVWSKIITTYDNGSETESDPVCITPVPITYTWIRYADTPTSGMSNSPEGKSYIGIAVNKRTPLESNLYSDYKWSLAKGDDGVDGDPGEDGTTYYTWIKYANDSSGTGLSNNPDGKAYLGFAYNKLISTESDDPADYTWSRITGEDSYAVMLTNEAHIFPATALAATSSSTTTTVLAFKGTSPQVVTVNALSGLPTGLSAVITANGSAAPLITFTAAVTLTATSGKIAIPVLVDGRSFSKDFSWSLSKSGGSVSLQATSQIISISPSGAASPSSVTVLGTAINTTISVWQYSINGGTWTTSVPTGVSRSGNTVTIASASVTAQSIAVRMADSIGNVDTITIAKVYDGAPGEEGPEGVSVVSVQPLYHRKFPPAPPSPDNTGPAGSAPAIPTGWYVTEPDYLADNRLYRTERSVFSDNSVQYAPVSEDTSWALATQAQITADTAATAAAQAQEDLVVTNANVSSVSSVASVAATAASTAQTLANAAQTTADTADRRMTVAAGNPTVGDATGRPIGAIWSVRSGDTELRRFVLTGESTWTQVRSGQDMIGDNAIGAAQIIDLAVTNGKIGDLSVGKLTVSGGATFPTAVINNLVGDNAYITAMHASQVFVTGANLLTEPRFAQSGAGWEMPSGTSVETVADGSSGGVASVLRFAPTSNDYGVANRGFGALSTGIPVEPGAAFKCLMTVRKLSGTAGLVYLRAGQYRAGQTNLWSLATASLDLATATVGQWVTVEGTVTMPADRDMMSLSVYASDASDASVEVEYVSAIRMASGSLIVDGAITTEHLQVGSIDVDRLDAETFAGKLIKGAVIRQEDSDNSMNAVELSDRTLKFTRDDEGTLVTSTMLGGASSDRLRMLDSEGEVSVSLDAEEGTITAANTISASQYILDGNDLADIVANLAGGVVATGKVSVAGRSVDVTAAATEPNRAWMELGEIRFDVKAGRAYTVSVMPVSIYVPAGAYAYMKASYTQTPGSPPKPTRGSNTLANINCLRNVGGGRAMLSLGGTFSLYSNYNTSYRVLFYVEFWSPSTPATADTFNSSTNELDVTVVDVGPPETTNAVIARKATSVVAETNPPPPVPKTYTKTYNQTWFKSWRGGSSVTTELGHGYYGGYQRYSMVGFDSSDIASDLSGATITKVEVYLTNIHWWGSSGTVHVGAATNTSAPSNPITSGTTVETKMNVGAKGWVKVGGFTTSSRSITLGVGAGTSTSRYGKFKTSGVQLRITYTK